MGKFSIRFHITEKQNDWDETVAMWESNPITLRFKYPVLVRSLITMNYTILFCKTLFRKIVFHPDDEL